MPEFPEECRVFRGLGEEQGRTYVVWGGGWRTKA